MRRDVQVVTIGLLGVCLAAVGCSGSEDSCLEGSIRCPCYGNGTCDSGLTCVSDRCVDLGGPGETGLTQGGTGGFGDAAGGAQTGAGGSGGAGATSGSASGGVAGGGATAGSGLGPCGPVGDYVPDENAAQVKFWNTLTERMYVTFCTNQGQVVIWAYPGGDTGPDSGCAAIPSGTVNVELGDTQDWIARGTVEIIAGEVYVLSAILDEKGQLALGGGPVESDLLCFVSWLNPEP